MAMTRIDRRGIIALWSACLCAVLVSFGAKAEDSADGALGNEVPVESHDPHGPHGPHGHGAHNHPPANLVHTAEMDDGRLPVVFTGDLDFSIIEMIAVQAEGRKKPLHTYVNEMIEQVVGRPLFGSTPYLKDPSNGAKLYAMDMFLSMWFNTRDWNAVPVVLVSHAGTKDVLKLDRMRTHFSMTEIKKAHGWPALIRGAMEKIHAEKESEMSAEEKEAQLISRRCEIVESLMNTDQSLSFIPNPTDINGTWISLESVFMGILDHEKMQLPHEAVASRSALFRKTFGKDTDAVSRSIPAFFETYEALAKSYRRRDALEFKKASQSFARALTAMGKEVYPSSVSLAREIRFNESRPFQKSWMSYLGALVTGMALFRIKSRAAFALPIVLFAAGLFYHVYGFVLRCQIAGRPPVTNMYESVIWVGFGCVLFAAIFDIIYRKKYYMLCGAGGGFICLVLMDLVPVLSGNPHMAGFESKINPLVPVLRNNFWLTVHVLTITLSYAAFMLGWVLGHVTLWKHLTRPAAKSEHHELHTFIYRVTQVGVLLVAIGTILGGVWAYYSWGRFWGWDPKETWAFITLLCYLVVLHGRFTGWWGNFGMSVGAVVCFLSVLMAWYGVNFVLGELGNGGLHSYGAGAGGKQWVYLGVLIDSIFTAIAVTRFMLYRRSETNKKDEEKLTSTDPMTDARKEFAADAAGE
jgi:ABC-type transport system involved in cytochrome c biogenesis permease subunit